MTPLQHESGSAFLASMRRAHDPPADAKQRVRAALLASLPLSVPPTAPPPTTPTASTVSAWTSLAAVVGTAAVIVGVSVGVLHMLRSSSPGEHLPTPTAVVTAAPSPMAPTFTSAKPASQTLRDPSPPETTVARRARPAATSAPITAPLTSEVSLVRAAHVARENGDATLALTYLARHRRDFPRGTLVEEREVETVLALCALGRVDEARAKASTFEEAFPSSAHADRVARSCARSRHEPAVDRALTR